MNKIDPQKITQIKKIIHDRYEEMDVKSQIRDIISQKLDEINKKSKAPSLDQDIILEEIKKKGIFDSLVNNIKLEKNISQTANNQFISKQVSSHVEKGNDLGPSLNMNVIDPSKRYLHLQLINGKAFIEYLTQNDNEDINFDNTISYFTFYVHFRGQRFRTKPVSCSCEPKINEGFLMDMFNEFKNESVPQMTDSSNLLSISDKIHIVMVRTDSNLENHLVSSYFLEWRTLLTLHNNKQLISIELMGTGPESKVPAGILNICLQLVPNLEEPIKEDILGAHLGLEHTKNTERERLFLIYAKQWWKEFLEIRDDHKNRLVKLFAQDENGTNRPVCSYVKPMRSGRLIDSPRQAARFVSLIGYNKISSSFGTNEKVDQWLNMHTFLVKKRGDCENHAILLCNLLLGFGLNAYVCLGTKLKNQPHAWVVTISYDFKEVIFWESLTGNRYIHLNIDSNESLLNKNLVVSHPYKTIGCLFNHKQFYANIQSISNVDTCCFNLNNSSKWKAITEDAISTVCMPSFVSSIPYQPQLCQNQLDSSWASNDLEKQLRLLTTLHRKEIGLNTAWDDNLSYILCQALSAYETERVTGLSIGNEEFDQAIKLAIPEGHSFKAFPIQLINNNAKKALATCLKSQMCEEIICCRGDQVKLALRVKIFTYPESVMAVWIMLACRYKIIV